MGKFILSVVRLVAGLASGILYTLAKSLAFGAGYVYSMRVVWDAYEASIKSVDDATDIMDDVYQKLSDIPAEDLLINSTSREDVRNTLIAMYVALNMRDERSGHWKWFTNYSGYSTLGYDEVYEKRYLAWVWDSDASKDIISHNVDLHMSRIEPLLNRYFPLTVVYDRSEVQRGLREGIGQTVGDYSGLESGLVGRSALGGFYSQPRTVGSIGGSTLAPSYEPVDSTVTDYQEQYWAEYYKRKYEELFAEEQVSKLVYEYDSPDFLLLPEFSWIKSFADNGDLSNFKNALKIQMDNGYISAAQYVAAVKWVEQPSELDEVDSDLIDPFEVEDIVDQIISDRLGLWSDPNEILTIGDLRKASKDVRRFYGYEE